jgi:GT2 family glycosyltransferase
VIYLHEDDLLTPNCIKDSVNAIETQGVDFIHGNAYELYQESGKKMPWLPPIQVPTLHDLLKKNVIHSVTTMYRKEIFDKLGGFNEDNKMHSFEEFEFHLRCLMSGFKIGYCNAMLGVYRRHPNQIIRTVNKKTRDKYRQELINYYL